MKHKFEISIAAAVVIGIAAFFTFWGHVPNTTTNYPHEKVAEPNPYGDHVKETLG